MERDNEVDRTLGAIGWNVLRFWDVEIKKNLEGCVQTVKKAVMQAKLAE